MGGEPFPLPADRQLCVAAYRVEGPGRVDLYAEPLGVGAPPLPDVPLFFDTGHYVDVPMESTYAAAWQATPRRWRDVIAPVG